MSESANVTLVKEIYAAFGRGDIGSIVGKLAPDVLWECEAPSSIPYAGVMRGPSEVGFFFDAIGKTNETPKLEMTEFVASDHKVMATGRYSATVKTTQKYVHTWVIHYWEIRNGQVSVYRGFFNTAAVAGAYS